MGTGILTPAHLSQESISRIKGADVIHALVPDPLGLSTVSKLNNNVKNLGELYYDNDSAKNGNNRLESYNLMVEAIMCDVRDGLEVCAIFYGHPGVFVFPSHVAVQKAKDEGYEAIMLPAISAEDCLFADLGIDPGDIGCQAYEASQFVFYKHSINSSAAMILWQLGVVGDVTLTKLTPAENGVKMLQERLKQYYPADHLVTLYEASTLPIMPPRIEKVTLSQLDKAPIRTITTLFVPPLKDPILDLDFCKKWNIDTSHFH
ncbi:MAG: SAM-dependent methyltransferase [Kangiellaceae bacterium]|nr:SAM-dependent methyltransferase [Kangiellaceae bacterium]MCW8999599.1 SAM-dependent methyltransferase [Kangiellaceae bacterium]MCW9017245.1 SAM-dependent methyltransferase [Kangiellaceae bacterium]